ncbi:MAG: hypothetical protein MJZ97_12830 [Bacteroidales bacterium]|nr:hypothetical protein [Bacteroidales bacterium]
MIFRRLEDATLVTMYATSVRSSVPPGTSRQAHPSGTSVSPHPHTYI